jgi:hypothetical protein
VLQVGFREKHSTIEQVHRITDVIENTLEERKLCTTMFLHVKQAFDKVRHRRLKTNLHGLQPTPYCEVLEPYIGDTLFGIKQGSKRVRFEVFTAVTMKNVVFWDIRTQFVPHSRQITSPLQSQPVNAM